HSISGITGTVGMSRDTLYRKLLDHLSTATLLVDPQGCIGYLNPAAEALLEASSQRALGQPLTGLFRSSAQPEDSLCEAVRTAAGSGQAFTRRQAGLLLAGGQALTADFAVTPVGESPPNSVVVEIFPLDRLLRISREEALVAAQKTTQMLIRGLAHEIKNPLGGIRG